MHRIMIDRAQVKQDARTRLNTAQVSPKKMTLLYLGIVAVLSTASSLLPSISLLDLAWNLSPIDATPLLIGGTFVSIMVTLMSQVLFAGYILYCMAVSRKEYVPFASLFDGFAFASKIISLMILEFLFIWLWSMLLFFPGIIAAYRYRFALLNLCQNPELTPHEALNLSKAQTNGYKMQLLMLDISFLPWLILGEVAYGLLLGLAYASFPIPEVWLQMAITSLWSMLIASFYLPVYQTSEILYFNIATQPQNTDFHTDNDSWE